MYQRDYDSRVIQLEKAARLLIEKESVRNVAKSSQPCDDLEALNAAIVGRLRKFLFGLDDVKLLEGQTEARRSEFLDFNARRLAEAFAKKRVRKQKIGKPKKRRGRPPKAPAASPDPVVGVWEKTKASAGAGLEDVKAAAAAKGSAVGRKPYVVALKTQYSLEARSPSGRRAYSYRTWQEFQPQTLADALIELRKRTRAGLRLYYYEHWLFRSRIVQSRLGRAALVQLLLPPLPKVEAPQVRRQARALPEVQELPEEWNPLGHAPPDLEDWS